MSDGFLSRWSRRKAGKTDEQLGAPEEAPAITSKPPNPDAPPAVTLEDVEKIDRFDPDFSAFMKPDVDPTVQQAALKKMFTDPHFNVMDGLDIYIDDYSKPDPLPAGMLERMVQSDMLNLFHKPGDQSARAEQGADQLTGQSMPATEALETTGQSDLTSKEQNPSTQLDKLPVEPEQKKT